MSYSGASQTEPHLPRTHLRALGVAVGITAGLGLFLLTAVHVMLPLDAALLGLLSQYFYGYDTTWTGAVAGLIWGAAVGFVGGIFLGFVHNVVMWTWALVVQARHESEQASDLLDNI